MTKKEIKGINHRHEVLPAMDIVLSGKVEHITFPDKPLTIDEPLLTEEDLPKLQAWYDTVIQPAKNRGLSVIVPAKPTKP